MYSCVEAVDEEALLLYNYQIIVAEYVYHWSVERFISEILIN